MHPRDALVRVLVQLADDVERFDSMILLQRRIIEDRVTHAGEMDDDEVSREAKAISDEASELVARTRQALDELRRLGDQTTLAVPAAAQRESAPALRRRTQTG